MYKTHSYFNEMEAQAVKDGIYVDYDVITAVNGYAVVKCTATEQNGKRFIRIALAATVEEAQEASGTMALYRMYNRAVPNEAYEANTKKAVLVETSKDNVKTRTGTYPDQKTMGENMPEKTEDVMEIGQMPSDCEKNQKITSITRTQTEKKLPKQIQSPVAETLEMSQNCVSVDSTTSAANTAPIDFRMNVGTYANREDNLFSQMLLTDQGKKYIQRLLNVKTPSPKLIPYVEKARAYLDAAKVII